MSFTIHSLFWRMKLWCKMCLTFLIYKMPETYRLSLRIYSITCSIKAWSLNYKHFNLFFNWIWNNLSHFWYFQRLLNQSSHDYFSYRIQLTYEVKMKILKLNRKLPKGKIPWNWNIARSFNICIQCSVFNHIHIPIVLDF